MTMPRDLVFVRHGLTEPNQVQRQEKLFERGEGELHPQMDEVLARYDYLQRLAPPGEEEARQAGEWLDENFIAPAEFDERYASIMNRCMETAFHLGGAECLWLPEESLIERDWGLFGATPRHERAEQFPHTNKAKEEASFFARLDNGENMLNVVYRVRDFMATLSRDMPDKRVLAVTHGELMWSARYVIERMMPQEWQDLDKDKTLRIANCCILWYSRQNPEDEHDVRSSLSGGWRRMINPVDPEQSPYGGEWQKLPGKRRLTGQALMDMVALTPRIILET